MYTIYNFLVTIFMIILTATVAAALGAVTFGDNYEIAPLKVEQHQGFEERA